MSARKPRKPMQKPRKPMHRMPSGKMMVGRSHPRPKAMKGTMKKTRAY